MSTWIRESVIYSIGAGAAFCVDLALLWALVEWLDFHYLVAGALSFLAGSIVVYWVSIRHAFSYRRIGNRPAEFVGFVCIGAVGVLLNLGLMAILVEILGLHYLVAKVISAGGTFLANLGARKWLLFTRTSAGTDDDALATEHYSQ